MGMSASQVRFLQLTERKSDIGRELQHLSLQKMDLTREMQDVSRNYQNALCMKSLKWSNNNGITYTDISYGLLMSPGAANGNKPVLISDAAGRIIVNDKYKKYAEMISESGSPGGSYSGETRDKIIAELVGVSGEQMAADASTSADLAAKKKAMEDARIARDNVTHANLDADKFIKQFLSSFSSEETATTSHASQIKSAVVGKGYLDSETETIFGNMCDQISADIGKGNEYTVKSCVNAVVAAFLQKLGNDTVRVMIDDKNNSTLSEYETANAAFKAAEAEYKAVAGENAGIYTAEEERKIAFYDDLFNAIAELGWKNDDGVENSDYMNQMLQNNIYYITTMTKNSYFDESDPLDDRNYEYSFNTDCADNYYNIFKVNDSDAHTEALAKYEHDKSVINAKESRIDTRMKNLETEQSAIQKMLESIEQIKDDNIERTYSLWA